MLEEILVMDCQQRIHGYATHTHPYWEIILYLEGEGEFRFGQTRCGVRAGTVIVMPPGVAHSSYSAEGFRNIAVTGDFYRSFLTDIPLVLQQTGEAQTLAQLLWQQRYAAGEYLSALLNAYISCLLQKVQYQDKLSQAVAQITGVLNSRFSDPELNVAALLDESGYARDYIRAKFRQLTGQTPNGYLTKVRIDHGRNMLDTYGSGISVTQTAQACGFADAAYFSRRFRQQVGMSPEQYAGRHRKRP